MLFTPKLLQTLLDEKCISLKVAHCGKNVTTIDIDLECFLTCIIYYKLSFWHPSFLYVDPSPFSLLNMKNLTYGNIFSYVTKEYFIYVDKIFKNMFATWIKYFKKFHQTHLFMFTYLPLIVHLLIWQHCWSILHHMKNNTNFLPPRTLML